MFVIWLNDCRRTGSDISGNSIASSEGESRAGEQSGTDDDMMQDKHSAKDVSRSTGTRRY